MTKQEMRLKIGKALEARPELIVRCEPGINLDFDLYLRRESVSRRFHGGSQTHRARSPFFRRGEGCV